MGSPSPIPAFAGKVAGAAIGLSVAAGAIAILNGVVGNVFNPVLKNNYTINNLTQFPSDLPKINGQMPCILFQFYQYQRPSILVAPTLTPYGGIALPLPSNLVDQSSQSYSEEGSSLATGSALEQFSGSGGTASVLASVGEALSGVAAGAGVTAFNNAAAAVGGANALNKGLAFAGVTQNPFQSILYNSPTFKRHAFDWTFIPETANDVETLNFILNKFRYHSMPDINSTTGGVLLNYPDMCVPVLIPQGYMYDFKQCVVEDVLFNYAPGDNPSFNTKNAPSAIKFTVKLIEIEYWIKSDLLTASGGQATADFGLNTAQNSMFGQAPYASGA